MCEAHEAPGPSRPDRKSRRLRLWEIEPTWHCSIIGTCLSLGDLRVLARKLRFRITDPARPDLQLHSTFVQKASEPSRVGKLLNKLLDRTHAAAIRRFRAADSTDRLLALWDQAYRAGDIPGPYWAAMTHPLLDDEAGVRIYGDVHMLSHLVGASNRADVANLRRLEEDLAAAQDRLSRDGHRHRDRLQEAQTEIAALKDQLASQKAARARAEAALAARDVPRPAEPEAGPSQRYEIERLRAALAATARERDELRATNRELSAMVPGLEAEVAALERALDDRWDGRDRGADVPDLDGRCLLYVGGRTPNVCRLRDLVARWNGELLHHDGGLERSLDELTRSVAKADAVLFPTDCISHNAALRVKDLCRRSLKPYVPLRSSGIASFIAGLRSGLDAAGTID